MPYSERAHERVLKIHSQRWEEMHALRLARGSDNDEYRRARQNMLDAVRAVRYEARKPRRGSVRRG